MEELTPEAYERAGLHGRYRSWSRPAVVVIDFCYGFTDPNSPLGADLTDQVLATRRLLDAARSCGVPVVFLTIAYGPDMADAGVWVEKAPNLRLLQAGSRWVEIDQRLAPRPDETLITKKYASAFFGTPLASLLTARNVGTVILAGATTSGCVRASAVDAMQSGLRVVVPKECVGDRARGPHEATLVDLDAKYADVVELDQVLEALAATKQA